MTLNNFRIPPSTIQRHLDHLAQIGNLGPALEDGFLRAPWSDEESAAMAYIADAAAAGGLEHFYDAVGNLFVRTPGRHTRLLQIGSHLDTVPRGGLFDGAAGIIAGLQAILAVHEHSSSEQCGFELVVWRCEESGTFNTFFMGSTAAFGAADKEALKSTYDGRTLEEAIRSQGYDPAPILEGRPTLSAQHLASIAGHLELHIEQANRLELEGIDIGVVTSIRAPRRYRVIVCGESAHSGATPMGLPYRRDANLAIAHMIVRADELLLKKRRSGTDLVQTVGVINSSRDLNVRFPEVYENAMTKVSAFGYFLLEIRGNVKKDLDEYSAEIRELLSAAADEFGTKLQIETVTEADPVEQLDTELQEQLSTACRKLGYSHVKLASGAGHDAAVVAQQLRPNGSAIPTGMLFIPCRGGISHNPLEFTTAEAIAKGADVLAEVLLQRAAASGSPST